jgi:nitrate/nitrite transporter NarK
VSFPDDTGVSAAKRWSMLAISLIATLSANVFINAIAFLARTAAGRWADRIGSRMRPLRRIAVVSSVVLLVLALADQLHSPIALAAMVITLAITGDNGLPFTATGYPLAFAVCGLFPLAALPFFPLVANRSASPSALSPL